MGGERRQASTHLQVRIKGNYRINIKMCIYKMEGGQKQENV
jgi:hypothetical protein